MSIHRAAMYASVIVAIIVVGATPAIAGSEARSPAWFAPIAAYYHHNPKITPKTDFATLLYGMRKPVRR